MIQYLKRLVGLTNSIELYEYERLKISEQISEINKKYLVQRKTQLTFLIIMYTLLLAVTYIESFSSMPQEKDDDEILYYASRVGIGFICIGTLQWLMIILSRYYWNDYKLSSRFMISSYLISVNAPLIIFYIPYGTIINELAVQPFVFGIISGIAISSLQPLILLIHNVITSSNSLARYYKNTQEFRIVSSICCAFYLPFIVMLFGVLFQVDGVLNFDMYEMKMTYNYKIIGLCVTYLTLILVPTLINNKYQQIIYYLTCIPFLTLLYIILDKYGINMFVLYGKGIINNIFVGMFVSDSLVMSITSYSIKYNTESPHDLYDNDNANDKNNMIQLVSNLGSNDRYNQLDNTQSMEQ